MARSEGLLKEVYVQRWEQALRNAQGTQTPEAGPGARREGSGPCKQGPLAGAAGPAKPQAGREWVQIRVLGWGWGAVVKCWGSCSELFSFWFLILAGALCWVSPTRSQRARAHTQDIHRAKWGEEKETSHVGDTLWRTLSSKEATLCFGVNSPALRIYPILEP